MGEWFDTEAVFSNNGKKIQNFAKKLYLFNLILFLLLGIFFIFVGFLGFEDLVILALVGVVVFSFAQPLAYLSTCFLHGFGELIENSNPKSVCCKSVETEENKTTRTEVTSYLSNIEPMKPLQPEDEKRHKSEWDN